MAAFHHSNFIVINSFSAKLDMNWPSILMNQNFSDPDLFNDIFTALNKRNYSLQGRCITILITCEKLSAFEEKILLSIWHIKKTW